MLSRYQNDVISHSYLNKVNEFHCVYVRILCGEVLVKTINLPVLPLIKSLPAHIIITWYEYLLKEHEKRG